jgi:hypothetical protein
MGTIAPAEGLRVICDQSGTLPQPLGRHHLRTIWRYFNNLAQTSLLFSRFFGQEFVSRFCIPQKRDVSIYNSNTYRMWEPTRRPKAAGVGVEGRPGSGYAPQVDLTAVRIVSLVGWEALYSYIA